MRELSLPKIDIIRRATAQGVLDHQQLVSVSVLNVSLFLPRELLGPTMVLSKMGVGVWGARFGHLTRSQKETHALFAFLTHATPKK